MKPSALRDCSTYQFRYATLSELEFHNKFTIGQHRLNSFLLQFPQKTIHGGLAFDLNFSILPLQFVQTLESLSVSVLQARDDVVRQKVLDAVEHKDRLEIESHVVKGLPNDMIHVLWLAALQDRPP